MHESQIKITRDEIFDLRVKLAILQKKQGHALYDKEIAKLEKEIKKLKNKWARQKTELYIEKGKRK